MFPIPSTNNLPMALGDPKLCQLSDKVKTKFNDYKRSCNEMLAYLDDIDLSYPDDIVQHLHEVYTSIINKHTNQLLNVNVNVQKMVGELMVTKDRTIFSYTKICEHLSNELNSKMEELIDNKQCQIIYKAMTPIDVSENKLTLSDWHKTYPLDVLAIEHFSDVLKDKGYYVKTTYNNENESIEISISLKNI